MWRADRNLGVMAEVELTEIAAPMPGGQLITIPAGHQVHATQSTRFIAAVTAFLSPSALPA